MHTARIFLRWPSLALALILFCSPTVLRAAEAQEAQTPPPKNQNILAESFGAKAGNSAQAATGAERASDPMAAAGQKMRVLLVAPQEATIAGRLHGTISKIHVKESERFKAGQVLVSFDCRELAAERTVAQAELRLHSTTNKANAELYAEQVIGTLEKNLSQAKVAEADAKIKAVNAKMANCTITAPFDGQVVELQAKAHETLQPGSPIMLIQNSRNLEAHVHVPSAWMTWIKAGTAFQAHIEETGTSYQAEVSSVGARVDPVSRTVKIYAVIPGDHPELLPGMSGYAEFKRQ